MFRFGNAVLGSKPGHPCWPDLLKNLFANAGLSTIEENRIEAIKGPEGLTDFCAVQ